MAVKGYDLYRETLQNGWEGSRHLYLYHNLDMQGSSALMMGNLAAAPEAFETNARRFKPSDSLDYTSGGYGHYVQFLTAQPYLLLVRFGKWPDLLAIKKAISNNTAHTIYWHFGQGMAQAKTDQVAAKSSLQAIKKLMKDPALEARMGLRSRTIDIMQVPAALLEGTIALAQKKNKDAIQFFTAAVNAEDTLHYAEPESWRLPARHFLGQAFLQTGAFEKAQKVFEEDLLDHPFNYWAISGLAEALGRQGKQQEAKVVREKYKKVFESADIDLKGAAY